MSDKVTVIAEIALELKIDCSYEDAVAVAKVVGNRFNDRDVVAKAFEDLKHAVA